MTTHMNVVNPDSGTEVIRAALSAHAKKTLNVATTAKDLGVAADRLLGFIERRLTLPPDVMKSLTTLLFHGHAELDLEHDFLGPVMREPARVIGVSRPPPQMGSPPAKLTLYPAKDRATTPAALRRPGWG
jgi:hypothetical protein